MELVRVTEAAAIGGARWMGRGDKNGADRAAVDPMRIMLNTVEIDGVIVIGEGAKDEAPMLFNGEKVGTGRGPKVDVAVDPIDGTTLLSLGRPNAIAVIAAAPGGSMYNPYDIYYMDKIAVGPAAKGHIDINAPVGDNLASIAKASDMPVEELSVVILERPRNDDVRAQVRATGARIVSITDGDVAGAIMAATAGSGVHVLMGSGGSPEGVVAACAIKALGGDMQCKLWPRHDDDRKLAEERGLDLEEVITLDRLVSSDDCFFAATGVSSGYLLKGVEYTAYGAKTESLVMRARTQTVRTVAAEHQTGKLGQLNLG